MVKLDNDKRGWIKFMVSLFIAVVISIILIAILNVYLKKKYKDEIKKEHYIFGYLFLLYLFITLISAGIPTLSELRLMSNYNPIINYIPLSSGINITTILNIIFFMPFGFLLPTLWSKFRKIIPTLGVSLGFSIIIEISQLFNNRATDIDDLIMNTLGALLGYLLFNILSKVFKKVASNTNINRNLSNGMLAEVEPYLYIVISLVGVFIS